MNPSFLVAVLILYLASAAVPVTGKADPASYVETLPHVLLRGAGALQPNGILALGKPTQPSWAAYFRTATKSRVDVLYNASGTGAGETAILQRNVDFSIADSALSDIDLEKIGNAQIIHFPVVLGAIDIVYNIPAAQIKGELNMTADLLALIFSGNISRWNDSRIRQHNPYLNYSGIIYPVVRAESSGATFSFTRYLFQAADPVNWKYGYGKLINWRNSTVNRQNGNADLVKVVTVVAGTLSYTTYGSTVTTEHLASARLLNADGNWATIGPASIQSAVNMYESAAPYPAGTDSWFPVSMINLPGPETWPIVSYGYALFYQDQRDQGARGSALASFMYYINTDLAQRGATTYRFVPLPPGVREANVKSLESMRLETGYTIYDYYTPWLRPVIPQPQELSVGGLVSLILMISVSVILGVTIAVSLWLTCRQPTENVF